MSANRGSERDRLEEVVPESVGIEDEAGFIKDREVAEPVFGEVGPMLDFGGEACCSPDDRVRRKC